MDHETDNQELGEGDDQEAAEPQIPGAAPRPLSASSNAREMHQPVQPPGWWDPVHLASTVPEAAEPSVAMADPDGLGTPSDPDESLPPGRTAAEAVGGEEQILALTWRGVLHVAAAIGRFFIRFVGGV